VLAGFGKADERPHIGETMSNKKVVETKQAEQCDKQRRLDSIQRVANSVKKLLAETPQERHARVDAIHRAELDLQVSRLRNLGMADKCGKKGCPNKPLAILLVRLKEHPERGIGELTVCARHINIGKRPAVGHNLLISGNSTLSTFYVN
jgi:hypothetical protein